VTGLVRRAPPLVLTPGEPGGVGHEITIKAWKELHSERDFSFALLTDINWLADICQNSGVGCPSKQISHLGEAAETFADVLPVLHRPLPVPATLGVFTAKTASWVTKTIQEAVELCLSRQASAVVTNPIQKEALYASGFNHEGHTDFLAELSRQNGHSVKEAMMLVGGGIRAVPVTVHIPLKEVPAKLTRQAIMDQARTLHAVLISSFGIESPRLAATGLNPHAGENGAMGREELETIAPALEALRAEGMNIVGPLPADTAFFPEMRASYDAILCMYHDQALIPVKALDFHGGVNVTLGLPFVRTSPDHGTALAIAGTGKARADSMIAAIKLAAQMASRGQYGNG
jgi:4-hydroxythreonine-4-phosphate dehydrogenase